MFLLILMSVPAIAFIVNIMIIGLSRRNNQTAEFKAPIKYSLLTWAVYLIGTVGGYFAFSYLMDEIVQYANSTWGPVTFLSIGTFFVISLFVILAAAGIFIMFSNLMDIAFCIMCLHYNFKIGILHFLFQIMCCFLYICVECIFVYTFF